MFIVIKVLLILAKFDLRMLMILYMPRPST
jgi:hypothetical protein